MPRIFKALICTPCADTNPKADHPRLSPGKRGVAVALRTGRTPGECEHILGCVRHWCGHMGVSYAGGEVMWEEVRAFARKWF